MPPETKFQYLVSELMLVKILMNEAAGQVRITGQRRGQPTKSGKIKMYSHLSISWSIPN
jgi:hypothetical protein